MSTRFRLCPSVRLCDVSCFISDRLVISGIFGVTVLYWPFWPVSTDILFDVLDIYIYHLEYWQNWEMFNMLEGKVKTINIKNTLQNWKKFLYLYMEKWFI
jgi:hypothetical protein